MAWNKSQDTSVKNMSAPCKSANAGEEQLAPKLRNSQHCDPLIVSHRDCWKKPGPSDGCCCQIEMLVNIQNTTAWNSKQPVFYGCFNWMIPNHYIKNGCFTKHPLKHGCLGYQEGPVKHPDGHFWTKRSQKESSNYEALQKRWIRDPASRFILTAMSDLMSPFDWRIARRMELSVCCLHRS